MTAALMVVSFLVGLALLAVGAWLVEPAAGLIVAGVVLVAIALLDARSRRRYGG